MSESIPMDVFHFCHLGHTHERVVPPLPDHAFVDLKDNRDMMDHRLSDPQYSLLK